MAASILRHEGHEKSGIRIVFRPLKFFLTGERHVLRYNSSYRSYSLVDRGLTDLAAQQELGLLSLLWFRHGYFNPPHPYTFRALVRGRVRQKLTKKLYL